MWSSAIGRYGWYREYWFHHMDRATSISIAHHDAVSLCLLYLLKYKRETHTVTVVILYNANGQTEFVEWSNQAAIGLPSLIPTLVKYVSVRNRSAKLNNTTPTRSHVTRSERSVSSSNNCFCCAVEPVMCIFVNVSSLIYTPRYNDSLCKQIDPITTPNQQYFRFFEDFRKTGGFMRPLTWLSAPLRYQYASCVCYPLILVNPP